MRTNSPVTAARSRRLHSPARLIRKLSVLTAPMLAIAFCLTFAPSASASAAAPKPAKLTVNPTSHAFGAVVVGTSSASQSFAVTNTGQSTSGTLAVTVGGTDPGDYAVDATTCTGTLAAGAACSVSVHFAPTAIGARPATLSIVGTPGGSLTVKLSGTGSAAKLKLTPGSHAYGAVTLGAKSTSQTFTLLNTGAGPSGPVTVALSGANAADYSVAATTCGPALAAGSACTADVVFTPSAVGTRTATLTVSASPGGTLTANLSGSGAAKALLSISPTPYDFGSVVVGTSSSAKTFTVTNTGAGASGLVTVGVGGTNATDFTVDSTTCGAKLDVGASCTIVAHFTPSAVSAENATLSATATPGGTATAALQGAGATPAVLSLTPATFDFGSFVSGSASGQQTFTVTNVGHASSGTVSVVLSGTNQSDFTVDSTTCGAALPAGATCTIAVHFSPAGTGVSAASLSASASPGGTASSALTGTGLTTATLAISPTPYDFGPTASGASSATQTFTVTNTGQGASGTLSTTLTGSDASSFVIDANTCGASLPGGGTCTVAAHFTPGSSGTLTAGLAVSGGPGGTATASLQGEGLSPATLSVNTTFYDYGQVAIGQPTDATFTVTNTGGSPSGPISLTVGGTNNYLFRITQNSCTSLAAGASCTAVVDFYNFQPGLFQATFQGSATPGGSFYTLLRAISIQPAYFAISNPSGYGNTVVGTSSATQTITVTNGGQQFSGVVSAVIGGADADDFVMDTDGCTTVLSPHVACQVTIHFAPTAVGARSATFTVSGTPGGTSSVNLTGTGVNTLMVAPASYTFPDQPVGTTSASTDFTLTNYGSTSLSTFTISSSDASDFPVTADTCAGATVTAGATCKVSVAFNAAVLGQHSVTVDVSFTDGGNVPHTASFQASGSSVPGPPDLGTTLAVQSQNYNGGTVLITVTNHGSAPSVATTMTIDVDPTQSFSYSAGAGIDCTAQTVNGFQSRFTCPVPVIPGGGVYTRTATVTNLSSQAPHYVQFDATTTMPGDTDSSNNTGYALVTIQ